MRFVFAQIFCCQQSKVPFGGCGCRQRRATTRATLGVEEKDLRRRMEGKGWLEKSVSKETEELWDRRQRPDAGVAGFCRCRGENPRQQKSGLWGRGQIDDAELTRWALPTWVVGRQLPGWVKADALGCGDLHCDTGPRRRAKHSDPAREAGVDHPQCTVHRATHMEGLPRCCELERRAPAQTNGRSDVMDSDHRRGSIITLLVATRDVFGTNLQPRFLSLPARTAILFR